MRWRRVCLWMLATTGLEKLSDEFIQRLHARQAALAIHTATVEERGLHAGSDRAEIINRVDVPDVEALFRLHLKCGGCGLKDARVRLFVAHAAGVGKAVEAVSQAQPYKELVNLAIRVADHA